MCMKNEKLIEKAQRYIELKKELEELEDELDELKGDMIKELENRKKEKVVVGPYTISKTKVTQERFNSKKFGEENPEVYNQYVYESTYTRLNVK